MTQNSNAILTLCSHVCVGDGVEPFSPKEYSDLAALLKNAEKSPRDLFDFSDEDFSAFLNFDQAQIDRIVRLLDRSASLSFELGQYQNIGIETITRADSAYPKMLKKKLANSAPPIFYYAGDLSLLNGKFIGYVGSRNVDSQDSNFTLNTVRKTAELGYGVVSGGAKGIDTIAEMEAINCGAASVEYLSDSLLKKLELSSNIRNIQQGKLLILSVTKPDASFNVGNAMMRNRYIYAQSEGTVIVRSDLNKGGTWAGAKDNLRHNWCPTLCWEHPYPGNQALIQSGAIPITDDWDGTIPEQSKPLPAEKTYQQGTLFDLL